MQGLIRIPIQLDAICYARNVTDILSVVVSMTMHYQATTLQLWEKDTTRRYNSMNGERITWQQIKDCVDIWPFIRTEADLLKDLAFIGLYNSLQ